MQNYLIIGARGYLGSLFLNYIRPTLDKKIFAPSKDELDSTNLEKLRFFCDNNNINVCVNFAFEVGSSLNPIDSSTSNDLICKNVFMLLQSGTIETLINFGTALYYENNSFENEDDLTNCSFNNINNKYLRDKIFLLKHHLRNKNQFDSRLIVVPNIISANVPSKYLFSKLLDLKNLEHGTFLGRDDDVRSFLGMKDFCLILLTVLRLEKYTFSNLTNRNNILNIGNDEFFNIKDFVRLYISVNNIKIKSLSFKNVNLNQRSIVNFSCNLLNKIIHDQSLSIQSTKECLQYIKLQQY